MHNVRKWWVAAAGGLLVAGVLGVGAVMAQETPTSNGTATAQETPAANSTPAADATPRGVPGDSTAGPRAGGCAGGKFVDSEALATFLGIDADQLRQELQADGATLASVAEAHSKSRDALKAFITEQTTARLAEQVAAGDLTQAEADAKLADLADNLDGIIDGTVPFGRGFHRGPAPDAGAAPDSSSSS